MADITKRRLCVLGATGSVGAAALSVARQGGVSVNCLVAGRNVELMHQLCLDFQPKRAVMGDERAAESLRAMLSDASIDIDGGDEAVRNAASNDDCCTVIAAISGADGLPPVLEAAKHGRRILLANKEALVVAGELLMKTAHKHDAMILPIDSEHAALYELLAQRRHSPSKLWLTASGGALRDMPVSQLESATPKQVLAHPTWNMGEKITVDSATMMNKVLEVIEASILFGKTADNIGVVVHPQSVIHALVEDEDGTMTAQMSLPDMQKPIARMLAWPDSVSTHISPTPNWNTLSSLSFYEPDEQRYPALSLAKEALSLGGAAPAALSAANETAVRRFLNGEIKFTDIARVNARALESCAQEPGDTLEDLQAADARARKMAANE